jgi:large subunit ribosomal protein L10
MPTEEKQQTVAELKDKLSRSTITIATSYVGLKGSEMTELRRRLREKGIEYQVAKNTLAWIAAEQAGKESLKSIIQGQVALAFGYGDPSEAAKALDEYIKAPRSTLSVRGGEMAGRTLSPADVTALVQLPSKSVLLGQLVRQLQAPFANLVNILNSPAIALVGALQARVQQMEKASQ